MFQVIRISEVYYDAAAKEHKWQYKIIDSDFKEIVVEFDVRCRVSQ